MSLFKAIFKREFGSYFSSPLAYVFSVIFILLTGIFTFWLGGFYNRGQADLVSFFIWHPWLYLVLVPAVSMRLWAEERQTGTIELLFTLPLKPVTTILAKFLAAWAFIAVALLLTFPMVITVGWLGNPDYGVILASYMGSFMMAGAYLAIGIAFSSATKNQVVSFILSAVACLTLILIGFQPVVQFMAKFLPAFLVDSMQALSFLAHFDSIQKGVFDLRDLIYFASLIGCGLYATAIVLEHKKAE